MSRKTNYTRIGKDGSITIVTNPDRDPDKRTITLGAKS